MSVCGADPGVSVGVSADSGVKSLPDSGWNTGVVGGTLEGVPEGNQSDGSRGSTDFCVGSLCDGTECSAGDRSGSSGTFTDGFPDGYVSVSVCLSARGASAGSATGTADGFEVAGV